MFRRPLFRHSSRWDNHSRCIRYGKRNPMTLRFLCPGNAMNDPRNFSADDVDVVDARQNGVYGARVIPNSSATFLTNGLCCAGTRPCQPARYCLKDVFSFFGPRFRYRSDCQAVGDFWAGNRSARAAPSQVKSSQVNHPSSWYCGTELLYCT